jgi:hypothetical protein
MKPATCRYTIVIAAVILAGRPAIDAGADPTLPVCNSYICCRPDSVARVDLPPDVGAGIHEFTAYLAHFGINAREVDLVDLLLHDSEWNPDLFADHDQALDKIDLMIVRGDLDQRRIARRLREFGWQQEGDMLWWRGGESYYTNPATGQAGMTTEDDRFILANSVAVLRAARDDPEFATSLTESSRVGRHLFSRAHEDAGTLIAGYIKVPTGAVDGARTMGVLGQAGLEFLGVKGIGTIMNAGGQVVEAAFLVAHTAPGYRLEMWLTFDSPKSASFVSGLLQMATGLKDLVPPGEPGADILTRVRVERQDAVLRIRCDLAEEDMRDMMSP